MEEDLLIKRLEAIYELPAVKRFSSNRFVKKKFEKLKGWISKPHKEKNRSKRRPKLSVLNWVLINLIVVAYIAGLSEVRDTNYIGLIFEEYKILGVLTLSLNFIAFCYSGFVRVFRIMRDILLEIIGVILSILVWIVLGILVLMGIEAFLNWLED